MCFSSIYLRFCCPEIICTASKEASQDSIPVSSSTAVWRIYSCFGSPCPCKLQPPEQHSGLSAGTWHSSASPGEEGLGEISVVLWFDSQLSVVRSCSAFGVHSTAVPVQPWDGLIQLFLFTPQIFIGLSIITLHKHGGNICKVGHVEALH